MGKMKNKIFVLGICAVVMVLLTQKTVAYYTAVGKATNVITTGDISFEIHETTNLGGLFPSEGVIVLPGDVVSKQVSIESVCDQPFYLRVKIEYGIDSEVLGATDCFALNVDTVNWTEYDGWYYYNSIVEPGDETPYLFTEVEIVGSKVDNRYIGKTLTLDVIAQAVQSVHNPLVDGHVYTASGWPQE